MSIGSIPPVGPGGDFWYQGEAYDGDPTVAPGLARPIGWRVRMPDGTAAWDKVGPLDTDWSPVGGAVATLAQVYAHGVSDPKTKDFMGMLSGTTARFQANTDANPLPLIGLYETAASKPLTTSGNPSIGQSLATDLSILIGGRLFNWYEMFDPLWNGTFAQLSAYAWHVDTVSFQQTAATAWRRNHVFADRSYTAAKNWQPQATPAGPLGSGPGTMLHLVSLYNTIDDALEPVDQLDGFGQNLRQVSPIQNGVIYETATHFSHRLVSAPAAGDGVGWGVWDGNISHGGDVPRAALHARQTGATAAGDWYWALALEDTAGDAQLHDVATFKRDGIAFDAPISQSVPGAGTPVVISAAINWMVVGFYNFVMPLVAGKKFVVVGSRSTFETRDAALTTGATLFVAQNGIDLTTTPIGLSPATVNAVAAPVSINSTFTNLTMADLSTQVLQAHVSVAAAGAGLTTCTGHLYLVGVYV